MGARIMDEKIQFSQMPLRCLLIMKIQFRVREFKSLKQEEKETRRTH
jgi:hypothetical protein